MSKGLETGEPRVGLGIRFPIQLGYREHLCVVKIQVQGPFPHFIFSMLH